MARTTLILAATLVLFAGAPSGLVGMRSAAAQSLTTSPPESVASVLEALGSPARPRAVRRLLRTALQDGSPALDVLADALGRAGGHAALEAATRLARDRDPRVRLHALGALELIGLRSGTAASLVFRLALEGEGRERLAAVAALGVVGDGRDVELLLALARSSQAAERSASFAALRRLTDVSIPAIPARWTWHWRTLQRRAQLDLERDLAKLEADPEGSTARSRRAALARQAWVDLEPVDDVLRRWARSTDPALRAHACWIIAELRLADHADEVRRCHVLALPGSALAEESARALRVLGVPGEVDEAL